MARRRISGSMVGIALFAVSACSTGSGTGPTKSADTKTASIQQVASVVTEHSPEIRSAIEYETSCNSFDCITASGIVSRAKANSEKAAAFYRGLRAVRPYPPEVRALALRTERALLGVVDSYNALVDCTNRTGTRTGCEALFTKYDTALGRDMPRVLSAWEPYV